MDLLHISRLALGTLSAHATNAAANATDRSAVRAHESARAVETRLAVAKILGVETNARSLASATSARGADAAASTRVGTTTRARSSSSAWASGATTDAASASSTRANSAHRRRSRQIVCLLNADDLRAGKLRLLA
jgi:hypothetical protein